MVITRVWHSLSHPAKADFLVMGSIRFACPRCSERRLPCCCVPVFVRLGVGFDYISFLDMLGNSSKLGFNALASCLKLCDNSQICTWPVECLDK